VRFRPSDVANRAEMSRKHPRNEAENPRHAGVMEWKDPEIREIPRISVTFEAA